MKKVKKRLSIFIVLVFTLVNLFSYASIPAGASSANTHKITFVSKQGIFDTVSGLYSAGNQFGITLNLNAQKYLENFQIVVQNVTTPMQSRITNYSSPRKLGYVTTNPDALNHTAYVAVSSSLSITDTTLEGEFITFTGKVDNSFTADQVYNVDIECLTVAEQMEGEQYFDPQTEDRLISKSLVNPDMSEKFSMSASRVGGEDIPEPTTQAVSETTDPYANTTQPITTTEPITTTQAPVTEAPETTTQTQTTNFLEPTTDPYADTTQPVTTTEPATTTQAPVTEAPETTTQAQTTNYLEPTTDPYADTTQPVTTTEPATTTQAPVTDAPETTTQTQTTNYLEPTTDPYADTTQPISTTEPITTQAPVTDTTESTTQAVVTDAPEDTTYTESVSATEIESTTIDIETVKPVYPVTYKLSYLPSAKNYSNGFKFKLAVAYKNGVVYTYNFTPSNTLADGVPVFEIDAVIKYEPNTIMYQVYNGDIWVSQITKPASELEQLSEIILKYDGSVYTPSPVTTTEASSTYSSEKIETTFP